MSNPPTSAGKPLQRYHMNGDHAQPSGIGDWVRYADVATMVAERDKQIAELEDGLTTVRWFEEPKLVHDIRSKQFHRIEALTKANAAMLAALVAAHDELVAMAYKHHAAMPNVTAVTAKAIALARGEVTP